MFLVVVSDVHGQKQKKCKDLESAMDYVSKFPLSKQELNCLRCGKTVRIFIKVMIYITIKNIS